MRGWFLAAVSLWLAGCSCSGEATSCRASTDCRPGEVCRDAVCVPGPPDAALRDAGSTDAGPADAGAADAGTDAAPPPMRASVIVQTAGGGEARSARMRLWGAAGAPQPFGRASSPRYRLTAGPGSVP